MESILDVWNTAIGHLGIGEEVQSVDESSKPARACKRMYFGLLKSLMSSTNWFWATRFQKLTLLNIYPTPEWPFQYAIPNDCLRLTRIWNHEHTDTLENDIKYLPVNNGTQKTIVSEYGPTSLLVGTPWAPTQPTLPLTGNTWPIPVAQFVAFTDNVSLYPEPFKQGLAFTLAGYIAPALPGIGQVDLRKQNLELGGAWISQAISTDQNQARQFVDQHSIIQKAGQGGWNGREFTSYHAFNSGNFQA